MVYPTLPISHDPLSPTADGLSAINAGHHTLDRHNSLSPVTRFHSCFTLYIYFFFFILKQRIFLLRTLARNVACYGPLKNGPRSTVPLFPSLRLALVTDLLIANVYTNRRKYRHHVPTKWLPQHFANTQQSKIHAA